jgi:uncharacterized membrane protein
MALTRKQWIIIAGVIVAIAVGVVVGVAVVIVQEQTVEKRVRDILQDNPLIDG